MQQSHPLNNSVYDVLTIPISNPSVGTNFIITVPDNERLEILVLKFALVADANAADRTIRVNFNDGTTDNPVVTAGRIQTANETISYTFATGYTFQDSHTDFLSIDQHFPNSVILNPGDTITSAILNIAVGDQIALISIKVKRWIQE